MKVEKKGVFAAVIPFRLSELLCLARKNQLKTTSRMRLTARARLKRERFLISVFGYGPGQTHLLLALKTIEEPMFFANAGTAKRSLSKELKPLLSFRRSKRRGKPAI
ncbi:MAG: hypothetical protein ACK53V_12620 [Planctomycetota bacterium]